MNNKRYVLSVDLLIDGKVKTVCLASYDLIALEKYTSFCDGPKDLLKFMPNDTDFSVRNFLVSHIKQSENEGYDPFSIRTSESNKSRKIRIIYKKDVDVLLAGRNSLTERIEDFLYINIDDCIKGNIDSNKRKLLMLLYEKFRGRNFTNAVEDFRISKLNADSLYDFRYEIAMRNKWMLIGLSSRCAKALVKDAFLDDRKRIELAFILKDNTGDLLPSMSSDERSKAIEKLNDVLIKRRATSYYIRNSIKENTRRIGVPLINQNSESKKNKLYVPCKITEEKIMEYNRSRLFKDKNNNTLEKIMDISEEIENLRQRLDVLIYEKNSLEILKKTGSFIEKDHEIIAKLKNVEEQISKIKKEIMKLEYELNEIENGRMIYTDGGFFIEKDKNM